MMPETRFYHFKKSEYLLELTAGSARMILPGGRVLYSEKPSVVTMWSKWAHEGLRVSALEFDELKETYTKKHETK